VCGGSAAGFDDEDGVAEGVVLCGGGEFVFDVDPLGLWEAEAESQPGGESAVEHAGHVEEVYSAVFFAQGGPSLADDAVSGVEEAYEFGFDGEGSEDEDSPAVSCEGNCREQVESAGAEELGEWPEDGAFGDADVVGGGMWEDPASPMAAEEIDLGDAPAFVNEPEAFVVVVEFEPGVYLGESAGGDGEVAEDIGGFVSAYGSDCRDDMVRQVRDEEGLEEVLCGALDELWAGGDIDSQAV